jgi:putative oxidoreductase
MLMRTAVSRPSRALHVALWIVQAALAAMFGFSGVLKLTRPLADLQQQMAWVEAVPPLMVRFIGLAELAGALGVVLPIATGIRPFLTPLAALGLATIMVLALAFHVMRGEFGALPINLVLGSLAALVAWGRWDSQ